MNQSFLHGSLLAGGLLLGATGGDLRAQADFAKERDKIIALQNQNMYGQAIKKWTAFMKDPELLGKLKQNAAVEKIYFEAYYHNAYCWYRYSQSEPVVKAGKEQQFLDTAARYIYRLETAPNGVGWKSAGPQFQRLLADEPKLKVTYEKLKTEK